MMEHNLVIYGVNYHKIYEYPMEYSLYVSNFLFNLKPL
jgi:hypothetical protein